MRQEGGLGAVPLAQVQVDPQTGVMPALSGLWFVFGEGHGGTLIMAVQAEDELALLHAGRQPRAMVRTPSTKRSSRPPKHGTWC